MSVPQQGDDHHLQSMQQIPLESTAPPPEIKQETKEEIETSLVIKEESLNSLDSAAVHDAMVEQDASIKTPSPTTTLTPQPQEEVNVDTTDERESQKAEKMDVAGDEHVLGGEGDKEDDEMEQEVGEHHEMESHQEPLIVGGSIDKPAFAMLVGRFEVREKCGEQNLT